MAPSLQDAKITFIGGGNMAAAIIGGLLARDIKKENISVSEPWDVNRNKFADMGLRVSASNTEFSAEADVAILAVKPQVAKDVCRELGESWGQKTKAPLVISIAAGIQLNELREWFGAGGKTPPIVRTMPNTPALVGEGATGLYAGDDVSKDERELTSALIASVSQATEWVSEEKLLDVVTGISGKITLAYDRKRGGDTTDITVSTGSGPAYFFMMVENLISSAVAQGLPVEQATRLATQTCLGAGRMLVSSPEQPEQLRRNVTSPNGTTHAAIESFKAAGLEKMVDEAVRAAVSRSEELGKSMAA
jgi:pyrroline-5-carboxylate reductase